MEKNTKQLIIAGIAIVVVIAIAIAVPHFKKRSADDAAIVPVEQVTADKPAPVAANDGGKAAWDAMLKKYNGASVTFAADCTASPITQNQKKGTTVLLVNDSEVAHTITIGTDSYTIGVRHYKTVALNTAGTTIINCDAKPNVANIGVE